MIDMLLFGGGGILLFIVFIWLSWEKSETVMPIAFILTCVAAVMIWFSGIAIGIQDGSKKNEAFYRQGQIDYANGIIKYKLILKTTTVNEWVKKEDEK